MINIYIKLHMYILIYGIIKNAYLYVIYIIIIIKILS
jgi:hypothetical protein